MAAESAQPQPDEPPSPQSGQPRTERYGPLELLRTSKADGRALLLFSRRTDQREDDPR